MDDIGIVMTPFGGVETVGHVDWFYKVAKGIDKN